MLNSLVEYRSITRDYQKTMANVNKKAIVKRETDYYNAHISNIKTPEDLLKDDRLYRYIMKAYGLDDVIYAKGMVRKLLTEPNFAARIKDARFKALCDNFNFAVFKDKTCALSARSVVARYQEMALEHAVSATSVPASQALYFDHKIKELKDAKQLTKTSWAYQILSDKNLTQLVFKAIGASKVVMGSSIDAKLSLLKKHFKLEDFTDDNLRSKVITRALARYDMENSVNTSSGGVALQLLKQSSSSLSKVLNNLQLGG